MFFIYIIFPGTCTSDYDCQEYTIAGQKLVPILSEFLASVGRSPVQPEIQAVMTGPKSIRIDDWGYLRKTRNIFCILKTLYFVHALI